VDRFVRSVRYGFVRSRQLEGTFPGDGQTGVWPITSLRIGYGWGVVPEEMWPYGSDWPPVEPPGLDLAAKKHRDGHYKRVRTIHECVESLSGGGVMISLDITDKWANPVGGRIPGQSNSDIVLPTHHIILEAHDPSKREFRFLNSWGRIGATGDTDISVTICWEKLGGKDGNSIPVCNGAPSNPITFHSRELGQLRIVTVLFFIGWTLSIVRTSV
jgi:hypothetical protein